MMRLLDNFFMKDLNYLIYLIYLIFIFVEDHCSNLIATLILSKLGTHTTGPRRINSGIHGGNVWIQMH